MRRTISGQESASQPAGVATASSFSSADGLDQAEQAQLDSLLEQLGAIDPVTRRELEERITKTPALRTYALWRLPTYLQEVTGRPVQTTNPQAEIESLLRSPQTRPTATSDTTAGYLGSPAEYARAQQALADMAASRASSSRPPLGARPVLGASAFHPPQYPAAIGPPSPSGSTARWTDPHAQSGRQSPRASYDMGYNSQPYGEERPSTLPAAQPPAGIASTAAVDRGVTPASYEDSTGSASGDGSTPSASDSASPDSWRNHLASTIRAYKSQLSDEPELKSELDRHVADQARLRLLYLAADSRDYAENIPAASPADQQFWKDELFGLRILLDTEGYSDSRYRSAIAAGNLESALDGLTQMSKLDIEHATFVTEVDSWGDYKPFPSTDFASGTEVILYAEIKNFASRETEKGHETKLRGSYEIFVQHGGQSIVQHDFGVVDETCRNQRHDYFVRYVFHLPENLNPGKYTLRLTINDLHGASVAQEDVDFSITAGEG